MDIVKLLTFWKKPSRNYVGILEEKYGLSKYSIIDIVKNFLVDKSKVFLDGKYTYQNLGGSNNYGFVAYISKHNNWIAKIAPEKLLQREAIFFEYHKNNFNEETGFAPNSMGYGSFENTDLEFLTLEKLAPSKKITLDQVYKLYSKSRDGQKLFDGGLLEAAPEIDTGTRIKDILTFLVCDFKSKKAKSYIDSFFIERMSALPDYSDELSHLQSVIDMNYELLKDVDASLIGFVHGDFKKSNMMLDSKQQLKLIDFQYYCQGIRVWDLAFYFSKSKLSFSKGLGVILDKLSTENERKYLAFLYIFALLLHSKESAFEKDKFKPVLGYLKLK